MPAAKRSAVSKRPAAAKAAPQKVARPKAPGRRPNRLTIRAYRVGFGDCFLLTFHYARGGDRHLLIDFGSTGRPKGVAPDLLSRIAQDIATECVGKLHAVVATHRHKDHISGFTTGDDGSGPGDVMRALQPDVVVQPWTEHPDLKPDATAPALAADTAANGSLGGAPSPRAFVAALGSMHRVAAAAVDEAKRLAGRAPRALVEQLAFLGENNLANPSAVQNLMTMGKRQAYVYYGSKSGLEGLLPGVKVHVLGPPTVEQWDAVRKQRSSDEEQFWHLQALAEPASGGREAKGPFNHAPTIAGEAPPYARWFVPRMQHLRGDQLLEVVRMLDKAMNNTSVILLFEIGRQAFLFPGDAQIENWEYALSKPAVRKRLAKVTLYKVGHHGSANATPKSLWALFDSRAPKGTKGRLRTVVSTLKGKHGDSRRGTEVPRRKLVAALEAESDFHSTEMIRSPDLKTVLDIPLR